MTAITERLSTALAGRYRLERHLGEGGMATVYLAHDEKHDRKVALKILRPELAAILGGERFLNEIKVTANLQHPNILPLYDSGEADTFLFYVMPYVEGESLRDRMNREKQLSVEDTVALAKDVADALHFAHEQGVVHRDIKPENILVQRGKPLVADFGIALAVSHAGGARLTETGLSLGTPHYMSPEQATGDRELDARSDVYSLGAMVYEMLTGEPPHEGRSVQAIVARILSSEPDPVTKHRPSVPPHVAAAVRKALDKTPADRFPTAAKFAEAITNPGFTVPQTAVSPAASAVPPSRRSVVTYTLAGALTVMTAVAGWALLRPVPEAPVSRYDVRVPPEQGIGGFFARIALTPDGSRLIYSSGQGGQTSLYLRERDQLEPVPLAGTNGALAPSVSRDGQRVAFVSGGGLHVISLRGGRPVVVADSMVGGAGSTWGPDGFIYADGAGSSSLVRVPAAGGRAPEWFTRLDSARGEADHRFPDALPNGRGVLFVVGYGSSPSELDIAVADTKTGGHRVLVRGAYARYASSGHLVYVTRDGSLMAVRFDQDRLEITGEPVALVSGVTLRTISAPDLALADDGTLMYTVGGGGTSGGEPVWVGRDGRAEPIATDWTRNADAVALSPDGRQLAVSIPDGGESHIWIRQLERGTASKLTFQGTANIRPSWTPDGQQVLFATNLAGELALYMRRADGTSDAVSLVRERIQIQQGRMTADGAWVVYREGGGSGADIYARRISGDTVRIPLATTEFQETAPMVSPDGRWLAYVSDETGRAEVYVRPFPDVAQGKWLVSVSGGQEPV